jgi:peptide/nickel transport system permease protein
VTAEAIEEILEPPPEAPPGTGVRAVLRGLRGEPAALAGLAVVVLMVVVAVFAPLLVAIEGQNYTSFHDGLLDSARGGVPTGHLGGISARHWLGVEPRTGRDLFARIVYGARVSLFVAIAATVLQLLIGLLVGLSAGLGGRLADSALSRFTDLVLAFPSLIFSIALLGIVPQSFPRPVLLVLVLALFGWAGTARITRGQAMTLKTRDYVAAARLAGARGARIAWREIVPGLAAPVITYAALLVPGNIVAEAGLSFLGVGINPPTPSWGQMLSTATTWFSADPMYVLIPGGLLLCTVLSFTLFGDGLRNVLDPRANRLSRRAD